MFLRALGLSACLALAACSATATGESDFLSTSATGTEGAAKKEQKAAQLPKCAQPLGTVALVDKDIPMLTEAGLTSPNTVLRLMITQSNCFQIVDADAPVGRRGRPAQPDYFLTPDIIAQNENAGGVDGSFARFLPGRVAQVASGLSVKFQNAEVAIYMTSGKTGVQVAAATGKATTADTGIDFASASGGRIAGGGAYSSTDIGKTVSAAILDAYANLVKQAQGTPQQVARAAPKAAPKR